MPALDTFTSGVPSRVLCLKHGADRWTDVPATALAHLQHVFACGRRVFLAPYADGRLYLFDFSYMVRSDVDDTLATVVAMAWYDEAGYAFFPPGTAHYPVEPASVAVAEAEAVDVLCRWTLGTAVVTGVHGCTSELRVFREKEAALGNAKLAWYGASPEDVTQSATAVRRPNWGLLGARHGRGLHLSPLRFAHLSMDIAEANYDDVARVLLYHTRANELKSAGGVNLLTNPSWYVIWCENTNPWIVPLCIVSFKKRPTFGDLGPVPSCIPLTIDMPKLRREIRRFLPSSMLQELEDYFDSDTTGSTPILVTKDPSQVPYVENVVSLSKRTTGITFQKKKITGIPKEVEPCYLSYDAAKQSWRSYSTAKRKWNAVNNTFAFSLNENPVELEKNYRGLIAWMRTWCRYHGQVVDVSLLNGPGKEVFTTPVDGTMHITVKHKHRSITLILGGRDLYIEGWRSKNGTFEFKPNVEGQHYTADSNRKVLSFPSNYSIICPEIQKTRVGQTALENAFEVLYKSEGKGTDEEKSAISIFSVHICEAARFQTIFRLVCESFWEFSVTELDSQSTISQQTHPNSWWVNQWSYYSGQSMKQMDELLSGKESLGIINRGGGTLTSWSEINTQIRILLPKRHVEGIFAYRTRPPAVAKETPPYAEGACLTPLSSVLNEWNSEKFDKKPVQHSSSHQFVPVDIRRRFYTTESYLYRPPAVAKETPPYAEGACLTPLSSVLNEWNSEKFDKKPVQHSSSHQFVPVDIRRRFYTTERYLNRPPLRLLRPSLQEVAPQRAPLRRILLQNISKIIRLLR